MKDYIIGENGKPFDPSKLSSGFLSEEDYRLIHKNSIIPCHDVYVECEYNGKRGILLIMRKEVPYVKTLWPLGGRILKGVPTEESLRIRVKDECGLEISKIEFLGVSRIVADTERFGHGKGYDSLALNYFVKGHGVLKLNDLHESPVIVNKSNYEELEKPLNPYVREFLRKAMTHLS